MACDRATADFIISSPLMDSTYQRLVPDYEAIHSRKLKLKDDEEKKHDHKKEKK